MFHEVCGVTNEMVISIILVRLTSELANEKDGSSVLKYGTININYVAWALYHGIHDYRELANAVNFRLKQDSIGTCLICCAETNIRRINDDYLVTTSPSVMSSDRAPMNYSFSEDSHYVVWSSDHKEMSNPWYCIRNLMFFRVIPSGGIYSHGQYTYGHPHLHVIGGAYHAIRAKETFHNCILAVQKGAQISPDDFFHPIENYFAACSPLGQDYIIACFVLNIVRIIPGLTDMETMLFLKYAFKFTWMDIHDRLNDKWLASDSED